MFTWSQIQQYFAPLIIETSFPLEKPQQEYDAINIHLEKPDYTVLQIDTTSNTEISLDEQLLWEINAKLPQPIENYATATTIYHHDERSLQALGAALEKNKLQEILALQKSITLTYKL